VEQDFLPLQMCIGRIPGQTRGQGTPYALPHLCGGSSGEGHDKQPVNIQWMFPFTHKLYDPLDKDSSFTAASRCRNQYIVPPRIQHFLLGGRKLYRHITLRIYQSFL
jgi:hypothetical protein